MYLGLTVPWDKGGSNRRVHARNSDSNSVRLNIVYSKQAKYHGLYRGSYELVGHCRSLYLRQLTLLTSLYNVKLSEMSHNHLIYQTKLVAFIDICAQSDLFNNSKLKLSSIHTHSAVFNNPSSPPPSPPYRSSAGRHLRHLREAQPEPHSVVRVDIEKPIE